MEISYLDSCSIIMKLSNLHRFHYFPLPDANSKQKPYLPMYGVWLMWIGHHYTHSALQNRVEQKHVFTLLQFPSVAFPGMFYYFHFHSSVLLSISSTSFPFLWVCCARLITHFYLYSVHLPNARVNQYFHLFFSLVNLNCLSNTHEECHGFSFLRRLSLYFNFFRW